MGPTATRSSSRRDATIRGYLLGKRSGGVEKAIVGHDPGPIYPAARMHTYLVHLRILSIHSRKPIDTPHQIGSKYLLHQFH